MSRKMKIWLLVAASLILLGGLGFVVTMTTLQWDFTKISTVKYETNTYSVCEDFSDISIYTSTADIQFQLSKDSNCEVTCYETEKEKHSVSVENGVLTITEMNAKKWYDYINFFSFGTPKITIWLPEGIYGELVAEQSTGNFELTKNIAFDNVDVSTSTGDILITGVSAGELNLSVTTGNIVVHSAVCQGDFTAEVSTGDTELTDFTCRNLYSSGDKGDATLENVIATGNFMIERSTGDVAMNRCDAVEICIMTDTGDVTGTVLSDKVFVAQTDTGCIQVPETTSGGKCKITTDTGDIKINITK